ncbi:MAG TPA: 8-amino-7-oxononanoate synthase [Cryomorphaceae bacterium]|nr:8-amino-7-oxononanoate synthase [Owenweeksia sp.]MBF99696.1 8-amino-7-oxononanoate synthase [Owenweeksia sp.]HAD96642.1 8-amino-7-oxononanoate synthase [Cryomorphaceae bacterium]HCQ16968.1 8-amino-7-oxononanoate synthase [Cryomorphaceae bacterium]|tara:strand:+ start:399 stop:1634 length:1236 start_codon:yes stop_codon:yes gene_type:complete
MDLFDKRQLKNTPLGQHQQFENYYIFPKLEGRIAPRMQFNGKEVVVWSINNYLGLADHPEVRQADSAGTEKWGLAYPMGSRLLTGHTEKHEELEQKLSAFVHKEATYLLNYGYQGVVSLIDSMVDRNDVIVYDSESHACIVDGVRLHMGKRFVYTHNDIENLEKQLIRAEQIAEQNKGGILLITEGVFGMSGDLGKLDEIVKLKTKYNFRLFIDDAHGFGTMGKTGAGTGEHFGLQDEVDLYLSTFAKSMAGIGAFVSGKKSIIDYLRYTMRSQIFAKALPMPMVEGALVRLELLQNESSLRTNLWNNVNRLQSGLREKGFDLGNTQSPVTPVYLHGELEEALRMNHDLRENYGIFCSLVVYPVVPKGVIMLRMIPSAAHSNEDIDQTIEAFTAIHTKLKAGAYKPAATAE